MTMRKKKTLSVIIVSYNSRRFLHACLTNLMGALSSIDHEIYLVDNHSRDDSVALVGVSFPHVRILVNTQNLGFGAACNKALSHAQGDYILLLNPDVQIPRDTLRGLLSYSKKHLDVGILTCKLLYPDGRLQYSCRRYPSLLVHFLGVFFPRSRFVRDYLMLDRDHSLLQEIDWSLGAFLLIRKKVFQQISGFDERFFLYFEDVDFCRRAKKAGWRIVYDPHYSAIHHHQHLSRFLFSRAQFYHLMSMFFYYRKHGLRLL